VGEDGQGGGGVKGRREGERSLRLGIGGREGVEWERKRRVGEEGRKG